LRDVGRIHEEHGPGRAVTPADEQPTFHSVSPPERIEAPIHHSQRPRRPGTGENPFRGPSELGSVPGRKSEVVSRHESRGNSPLAQVLPHLPGRVPGGPLDICGEGDGSSGTCVDPPKAWKAARKRESPNRLPTMPVAPGRIRAERGTDRTRDDMRRSHRAVVRSTDRSQSLAKRSVQARAVRLTSSEKPVSRCWTVPSSHSRKT